MSVLALFSTHSLAGATAQVNVEGGPGLNYVETIGTTSPLLIAELTAARGDTTATSFADLSAGILRDVSHATNAFPGTPYAGTASSSILDTVTFLGGLGQTAYLDYSFEGTLSLNPTIASPYATSGQMLVYIGSSFANLQLSAFAANCGGGSLFASCTVGTSVSKQGSIPFVIGAGPISLGASLSAYTQFGNTADFSNTGKLYLRAPQGVSYTSSTGSFLTTAAPIFVSTVPEPETYALMLVGLAALGHASKRRKA